ncbi:MAG: hypothetical protein Q8Q23_04240 [bacterium]|nr:hypothetical protein [bacterium]
MKLFSAQPDGIEEVGGPDVVLNGSEAKSPLTLIGEGESETGIGKARLYIKAAEQYIALGQTSEAYDTIQGARVAAQGYKDNEEILKQCDRLEQRIEDDAGLELSDMDELKGYVKREDIPEKEAAIEEDLINDDSIVPNTKDIIESEVSDEELGYLPPKKDEQEEAVLIEESSAAEKTDIIPGLNKEDVGMKSEEDFNAAKDRITEVAIHPDHKFLYEEHLLKVPDEKEGDRYVLVGVDDNNEIFNIFTFKPHLDEHLVISRVKTHNVELADAIGSSNINPLKYMKEAGISFKPGRNNENIRMLGLLIKNHILASEAPEFIEFAKNANVDIKIVVEHKALIDGSLSDSDKINVLKLLADSANEGARFSLLGSKKGAVTIRAAGEESMNRLDLYYKKDNLHLFLYPQKVLAVRDGKTLKDINYNDLPGGQLNSVLKNPEKFLN